MKLLFLTWDGPATNYHETLFIPILREARNEGDQIRLLQFTWGAQDRTQRLTKLATDTNMQFEACDVSGRLRPIKTAWAMLRQAISLGRSVRKGEVDTIMARSILPGGLAALVHWITLRRFSFIYDADGLSADERVEFSGWKPNSVRYRGLRIVERTATRRSDVVLVRSTKAVQILHERTGEMHGKFVVVANGKDELTFTPGSPNSRTSTRAEFGIPADAPVIVYVGSIGPQYEPEAIIETFRIASKVRSDTHLLVLTSKRNHESIHSRAGGLALGRLHVTEAHPDDVPKLLAIGDLGIAYRRQSLSQSAVAPIKVGEYLLCGVPVAFTAGIGDLDEQLDASTAFAVGGPPSSHELVGLSEWLFHEVLRNREQKRELARQCGVVRFSLSRGAQDYRSAFDRVSRALP